MRWKRFLLLVILIIAGILLYVFIKPEKNVQVRAAITQEFDQYPLSIEGTVPDWLKGTFVRNGPVGVQIQDQQLAHWFDGPAMLHAFAFQNSKALYSNKFLRTSVYDSIFIKGDLNYGGFASSPKFPLWDKMKNLLSFNAKPKLQNANVNVAEIANQYVALTETPLPVIFDIQHLNTLGALMYEDTLPKSSIFESAHMLEDRQSGEKINYLVEYGKDSHYVVYKYGTEKPERVVIGRIPVKKPSYMHSFALTQNYIILVEFPFTVNPIDLAIMRKPFIKNFNWHPEEGTHFLIIDRKTGALVKNLKYDTPFFAFHHVNAYEEGDNVILDIVTYPNASIISDVAHYEEVDEPLNLNLENKSDLSQLLRFSISMVQDKIESATLLGEKVEFPRINDNYIAHLHRYVYAVNPSPVFQAQDLRPLYKIDTQTHEKILWQMPGVQPGEPVFIAKPGATEEDDGVVVTIVLDANQQKAFLLMLDGKSFREIARIYTPEAIPVGLHAQFFKNIR